MPTKYFTATVKLIIAVPLRDKPIIEPIERARYVVKLYADSFNPPDSDLLRLVDWGYAPGPNGRHFMRECEVSPDFFDLRDAVKRDEQGPDPTLEIECAEIVERHREYEMEFDKI